MLRAILVLAGALGCFSLAALAQPPGAGDKKAEVGKGKDTPKTKGPAEQKLPKNAIVVVVENVFDAMSLFNKSITIPFEKYQDMVNEIDALKKQLKSEKKLPGNCVLYAKLQGDLLVVRAEYKFQTEQPNTTVLLGLQGGHLTPDGDLDREALLLDATEDGFTVRVEKEGKHQLTLNFSVPVQVKKSSTGGIERGIELGLPGAAVMFLNLELPKNVKEVVWNKTLEKTKKPGSWSIGLERTKTLSLSWKEPAPLAGNTPLIKADTRVKVEVDATHVNMVADLFLEDRLMQTKEWQLLLPPQANLVEVTPPTPGLTYEWLAPEKNAPYYVLRTQEATAGQWQVSVSLRVPRPNAGGPRVPIGPFHVLKAAEQIGTIQVKMPADVAFGQRLVYTRFGEVYQLKNADTEAEFKYIVDKNLKGTAGLKAPLELEWRYDKNQVETHVEHALKMKTVQQGWEIEATTRIQLKALYSAVNAVELKLPLPRPRGVSMIGTVTPGLGFPGSLPWVGMGKTFYMAWTNANPDEITVQDDAGNPLTPRLQDATGKVRVILERGPAKQVTLILKNSYRVPAQNHRIRMELPRPINTQDRGAKLSVQTDDRIELLHGPEDAEEPVPDRHHFELAWDQTPAIVELAWQPFQRDVVAQSTIDITLHPHSAQVRQTLRFPRERAAAPGDAKSAQIQLLVPREVHDLVVASGGELLAATPGKPLRWLRPAAGADDHVELRLQYDLAVGERFSVTPVWPVSVSQKDVKVRIWAPPGIKPNLGADAIERGQWKERSIEAVPDKEQFPALVLHGHGSHLPLILKIDDASAAIAAAFLAERALIQVHVGDDGSQQCRARYFVRRFMRRMWTWNCRAWRVPPTFKFGSHILDQWERIDGDKAMRVKLHPDLIALPAVLEIDYTIPADEPQQFLEDDVAGAAVPLRSGRRPDALGAELADAGDCGVFGQQPAARHAMGAARLAADAGSVGHERRIGDLVDGQGTSRSSLGGDVRLLACQRPAGDRVSSVAREMVAGLLGAFPDREPGRLFHAAAAHGGVAAAARAGRRRLGPGRLLSRGNAGGSCSACSPAWSWRSASSARTGSCKNAIAGSSSSCPASHAPSLARRWCAPLPPSGRVRIRPWTPPAEFRKRSRSPAPGVDFVSKPRGIRFQTCDCTFHTIGMVCHEKFRVPNVTPNRRNIVALLAFVGCASILLAQQGNDLPASIQRIIVSRERFAKEMEKQGTLIALPLAEFDARLERARQAVQARAAMPRLTRADYRAELSDRYLTNGSGQWTIQHGGVAAAILPISPLNLALHKPKWEQGADALLGDLDGSMLGLFVPQAGSQACLFDWSARGTPTSEGIAFSLMTPPCPITTFEFKLPAESWLSAPEEHGGKVRPAGERAARSGVRELPPLEGASNRADAAQPPRAPDGRSQGPGPRNPGAYDQHAANRTRSRQSRTGIPARHLAWQHERIAP